MAFRESRVGLLAVQWAALLVACLLVLLGVMGFLPGLTTGELAVAGNSSSARLFGVFEVSAASNLVHLTLGLAGLALATSYARARAYLLVGGLGCLGLWIYGLLIDPHGRLNVAGLNNADNWLHFGLGVAMVVFGLTLAGGRIPKGARGESLLP